ncbi:hypothetical protein CRI94_09940 [Longibacter salinarum]|uniref:CMP/dCMP-type deaminase domain-containing protein n=1 Tax=Longibacter salinarum TaxID=1850348 RepID=A0A2A8CZ02_9BACT|nr:nucleoside deaminase [Longibacter salinarum]PEN13618.1 hypothetical protein CRI94_09940 [Longibacter salinarum]
MSVDVLLIDAFGPLLHRATGRAGVGASALMRRAVDAEVRVIVTDLRGAGDVEDAIVKAGIEVPTGVDIVPSSAGESPQERIQAVADRAGAHPAQSATVVSTPWAAFASVEAGATVLAVAKESAAESLQQSGARGRYDTARVLADDLEEALARCGPQTFAFTPDRLNALMDDALKEASKGLETNEIPIGSTVVSGDGDVLGQGYNVARSTGRPTAHAEMEAIADAFPRHDLKSQDGLVLVTTMEPCAMCFGAALELGVDAIVYAVEAPENGAVGRCTPNRGPDSVHPRVVGGVGRSKSIDLLRDWESDHENGGFVSRLLESIDA